MIIELSPNQIRFSKELLGTDEAWLWVGSSYSPTDNDDERVKATRELMEKYYPSVPYGMWVGNRGDDRMIPLADGNDGYYTLDLHW